MLIPRFGANRRRGETSAVCSKSVTALSLLWVVGEVFSFFTDLFGRIQPSDDVTNNLDG